MFLALRLFHSFQMNEHIFPPLAPPSKIINGVWPASLQTRPCYHNKSKIFQ